MSRRRMPKRAKLRPSSGMGVPRRINELEDALRPFARFTHETDATKRAPHEVFVPTEGDVWFYVGRAEQVGRCHLHTDDFKRARRVLEAS